MKIWKKYARQIQHTYQIWKWSFLSKLLTTVNCKLFLQKRVILDVSQVLSSPLTTSMLFANNKTYITVFWNGGSYYLPRFYEFKVNNRNTKNTRASCEMCLELSVRYKNDVIDFALVFLLLTFNRSSTLIWCFCRWFWASKW